MMIMIRTLRLSSALTLCLFVNGYANLSSPTIKQQVELASEYACMGTKTTKEIALNVLTNNGVDTLFATYSAEEIFGWLNGESFIANLLQLAHAPTKKRLVNYLKPFTEKLLKKIVLESILCETTPTALQALYDYFMVYKLTSDLTSGAYKEQAQRVAPLLKRIIVDEKNLNDKGYVTFFHSQRWEYLLGERLFTDLWALTNHKKRPTDYLFVHVRLKGLDPLEKGPLNRYDILNNGRTNDHDREVLLFTNNSLFGNYKKRDGGSCLSFFLKNDNRNYTIHLLPQDIFTHYNLSKFYKSHAKEIATMKAHYDAARTLGTIIMVAIPQHMVNDYCFSAKAGGYKKWAITNTYNFIESLKKNPAKKLNNEEFCVVMLDEAMNPESGILIKAYHCAEPTEYKLFETDYEKLIQKLTSEITTKK